MKGKSEQYFRVFLSYPFLSQFVMKSLWVNWNYLFYHLKSDFPEDNSTCSWTCLLVTFLGNISSLVSLLHFCLHKKTTVVLSSNLKFIFSFRIFSWRALQEGALWCCSLNTCSQLVLQVEALLSFTPKLQTLFSWLRETEGKLILPSSLLLVWFRESRSGRQ